MLTLRIVLLAIALLAPFATYAAMRVREEVIVAGVRETAKREGILACNERVAKVADATRREVAHAVELAREAEDAIEDTPEGRELIDLCNRSASCRSRGTK